MSLNFLSCLRALRLYLAPPYRLSENLHSKDILSVHHPIF